MASFVVLLNILPHPTHPGAGVGIACSSFPGAASKHYCKMAAPLKFWYCCHPLASWTLPLIPQGLYLLAHNIPSHCNPAILLGDVTISTDDLVNMLASQFLNFLYYLQHLLLLDLLISQISHPDYNSLTL